MLKKLPEESRKTPNQNIANEVDVDGYIIQKVPHQELFHYCINKKMVFKTY